MMQRRIELVDERLEDLLIAMRSADLAPKEHVLTLRDSLAEHYEEAAFLRANSMGDLVTESISMIQEQLRSVEDENLLIPYGDL